MNYKLFLTDKGQKIIADASTTNGVGINISHFAVGQGVNVDFSKRLDKQALVSQRYKSTVNSVKKISNNEYEVNCIVPADIGGWTIRELGLFSSNGDLIWVGNIPEVDKPASGEITAVDYRLNVIIRIDNTNVSLIVDANVVTATRAWVDEHYIPRSALELIFPMGYPYWTHINQNPKPLFDALFGYETFWRRLQGVHLVAVDDDDRQIDRPMFYVGENGNVEASTTPEQYKGYTKYLFERYDPNSDYPKYDGTHQADGTTKTL